MRDFNRPVAPAVGPAVQAERRFIFTGTALDGVSVFTFKVPENFDLLLESAAWNVQTTINVQNRYPQILATRDSFSLLDVRGSAIPASNTNLVFCGRNSPQLQIAGLWQQIGLPEFWFRPGTTITFGLQNGVGGDSQTSLFVSGYLRRAVEV